MSILAAVALLSFPQRGGDLPQRPVSRGNFQIVTTSWIRMNDPAFIRELAGARLPSGVVSPLQPFELKISAPGGTGNSLGMKPGNLNYAVLTRGIRPVTLANPISFGEVLQNGAPVSSYYENIATQDGTIKVPQLSAAPFRATRITTYLGVLPSGKLKEDASTKAQGNSDLSLSVKAGQAYRVDFSLDPKGQEIKKYSAVAHVDDGNPTTVNLLGSIVGPKGKLQITKDPGDIIAVPGKSVTFNLYVKAEGNSAKTQVQIQGDPGDLSKLNSHIESPTQAVTIKNNEVTTIPVTLRTGSNYDRSLTLNLTVKGYDGASTTAFAFPVSIVNQWIDSGLMVYTRNVKLAGGGGIVQKTTYRQFRMNAYGIWSYNTNGYIDDATLVFMIGANVNGKKYAVVDPKYGFNGNLGGTNTSLGQGFDAIKNGSFNLYEGKMPQKESFEEWYGSLVETHDTLKKQGVMDLNEEGYQKMLKELKK